MRGTLGSLQVGANLFWFVRPERAKLASGKDMKIRILIQESEGFGLAETSCLSNKSFSKNNIRNPSKLVGRLRTSAMISGNGNYSDDQLLILEVGIQGDSSRPSENS